MDLSYSYCHWVNRSGDATPSLHKVYHDTQYGFPLLEDNALFGRLILEINQAGLSWSTILQKQQAFFEAYDGFDIARIAAYGETDRQRLLQNAGIIRNRLKIDAAIHNAQRILALQEAHGSFRQWLDLHHPLDRAGWTKLFKKTFKFTGGEIVNEFLLSTGYLPGAHHPGCAQYAEIATLDPAWMRNKV